MGHPVTSPRAKTKPVVVNSTESLSTTIGLLRAQFLEHKYLRVTIKTGRDRSLDQNAISHCWYEQIARELGEYLPIQVKAQCKLYYGVPILRAQDEEFRAFYDQSIKRLTHEQKLQIMEKEFCPVTSLMTTAQMKQYLDDVQRAYADRVVLEYPEE